MIEHRCERCIWWDNRPERIEGVPVELNKTDIGFCRKHKPGGLRIGQYYYGVQPITDGQEFCGEFRAG